MPTIAQLNQRHPSCDVERIGDLKALYDGGKELSARVSKFLLQRPREPQDQYYLRTREFYYRNYLGPIIDYFASMLFTSRPQPVAKKRGASEPLTDPGEYYSALRDDCDRTGTDLDSFFKERFTEAMVARRAWIRLSHPSDDGEPSPNRSDFDARGLGNAWLSAVPYESVLDWETDDAGNLEWAIVRSQSQKRLGPGSARDTITVTWEFLTRESVATYRITYPANKPPSENDEAPQIGLPVPHRFGRVPLVCVDFAPALWVANRLESPQKAHLRAINALSWSLTATCYAMPVAKVRDPEAFVKARQGAGYGIVIGTDESWDWEAPPGQHFSAQAAEIQAHKDEIFRIAHQMALGVENNAAAVGRSAESKMADSQATRVVLLAFAKEVKEEIARVLDAISASRGDDYTWTVSGLDEFAATDLLSFLEALSKTKDIGGIPSKTANIQLNTKLAEALLPELDQATKATIRKEIQAGTPEPGQELEDEIERLHALASGLNGGSKREDDDDGNEPEPRGNRSAGRAEPPQAPRRRGRGAAAAQAAT